MNGAIIVVDYCLQCKEINRRFDEEDMARARDLLERVKPMMNDEDFTFTNGLINRLYEAMK